VGTTKKFGARQICPIGMKSRCGSQRKLLYSAGLAAKNAVTNSHVYPSGVARATSSAAIEPLAPDLISLMIEPFHCAAMFWATMRPNTSATLPAE
jgi:hypothetical protein